VSFKLNLDCGSSGSDTGYLARELNAVLEFYQNGILRVEIDEPVGGRFKISDEDLPVVWDQLEPLGEDIF
jgi:hypothetical protein